VAEKYSKIKKEQSESFSMKKMITSSTKEKQLKLLWDAFIESWNTLRSLGMTSLAQFDENSVLASFLLTTDNPITIVIKSLAQL
jgi:saccharopine dehydrogenase-like NADP-dependent oxidoreductase